MSRSNIIFFTGPNSVFLRRDLLAWKKIFIQKHTEINLLVTHPDTRDPLQTLSECLTPGFMGSARMIILHGLPGSATFEDASQKESSRIFEERFEKIIDQIPDTNFLVFVQEQPDKRTRFYKLLSEIATVKNYEQATAQDVEEYIKSQVDIEAIALRDLVTKKGENLVDIDRELQKLKLYKPGTKIMLTDIQEYVEENLESKIFDLVDMLLAGNQKKALEIITRLVRDENVFLVYASLMANLRKILYAFLLMDIGESSSSISKNLGIHPYILQKNTRYQSKVHILTSLYHRLTLHEYDAKTGGHPSASEEAIQQMIEEEILRLGKPVGK